MADQLGTLSRTHTCGELRASHVGQKAVLLGWIHRVRDLGGLLFLDVRDRHGITQVLVPNDSPVMAVAKRLRSEFVVAVMGPVELRGADTVNAKLDTGEVEILAQEIRLLSEARTPPFPVADDTPVSEDIRLRYRYLDLRRPRLQFNLGLRHRVTMAIRRYFDAAGFWEIETPILTKSTPEGARDYLVPSRVHPGEFFALPQSPQIFKQILMVGGMDRYVQICRCFRDEDLRADRQPEFTQVDVEVSFVTTDDIFAVTEGMLAAIFKAARDVTIKTPFDRLTYREALDRYGSDKPDRRFEMELVDVGETFRESSFKVFRGALDAGGVVKAINAKGFAGITIGQADELTEMAKLHGAKGLAFIKIENGEWKSPIVKFFSEAEKTALQSKLNIEEGDCVFFAADKWGIACEVLGRLRLRIAEIQKLTPAAE